MSLALGRSVQKSGVVEISPLPVSADEMAFNSMCNFKRFGGFETATVTP